MNYRRRVWWLSVVVVCCLSIFVLGATMGRDAQSVSWSMINWAAEQLGGTRTVGGNSPGDVVTTNTAHTMTGPITFQRDGGVSVIDEGTSASEFPLILTAPSIVPGSSVSTMWGKASSQYDMGRIRFSYVGSGSSTNYVGLGTYLGDGELRVYGTGNVSVAGDLSLLDGAFTAAMSDTDSSLIMGSFLNSAAPDASSRYLYLGKNTSGANCLRLLYYHDSDDSSDNYASIGVRAGGGSFQVYKDGEAELTGSGSLNVPGLKIGGTAITSSASELNEVADGAAHTTFTLTGDFTSGACYIAKTGYIVVMTCSSTVHSSSSVASSGFDIPSAYRPSFSIDDSIHSVTTRQNIEVYSAGYIRLRFYDYSGSTYSITGSYPFSVSWALN